ncbi:MAG: HAD family hydrolase [Oscillospiraceae bacterium]|nr:HAD family hydrolase [Oscillospiraceae bacterium]
MGIQTVLFDLDGTLLPMDLEVFIKAYFNSLAAKMASRGYEPGELISAIWTGIRAMVKNDGVRTNGEVFWETFQGIYGERVRQDEPYFNEYYRTDFQKIQSSCGFDPRAAQTVCTLKAAGYRLVLATNPVFPTVATESRIRWAGLAPEDFELCTTYDNIGFCKPNPAYYQEILRRLGLKPEECLMVGNDAAEDMPAETLGMKVFLLTDCLINNQNMDISRYPQGSFEQLTEYIQQLG